MKEEQHPRHTKLSAFMVDSETSCFKFEVSKSNSWKITSSSKTMALQRGPLLTMCYTFNLSPLLVTTKSLSNFE
jgi:hypothetical protein